MRQYQLSLVQWSDRFDVSSNGVTALLGLTGQLLSELGLLQDASLARLVQTVPHRQWQNRADRLREQLLKRENGAAEGGGGRFDGLRFYAMCPDAACGKLYRLNERTRRKEIGDPRRCDRRLFSERTEWPQDCELHGTPRPVWEHLAEWAKHRSEPVCGQPLTHSYSAAAAAARSSLRNGQRAATASQNGSSAAAAEEDTEEAMLSLQPLSVFTYRSLRAGLSALLGRQGMQAKCEAWRQRVPRDADANPADYAQNAAAPNPPAPADAAAASNPPCADGPVPMELISNHEEGAQVAAAPAAAAAAAATAAAAPAPAPARCNLHMHDVYDGQLWRDMHYWPPLEQQAHVRVPNWWQPEWRHRAAAAAASPAAADAAPLSEFERTYDGRLLAAPGTIALQLFADWYQKHAQGHHSVGLLWACVLNLPREERYELHNMLLVGVLPGPKGTSKAQLQGVLQVVRDELIELFKEPLQLHGRSHRVYLHMLVGDLMAVRPAMGFKGPTAAYGCTLCNASFSRPAGLNEQRGGNDHRLSESDPLKQQPALHADHERHARIWVNCPDLPAEPDRRPAAAKRPASANQKERRATQKQRLESNEAYASAMRNDARLDRPSALWSRLAEKWRRSADEGKEAVDAAKIERSLAAAVGSRCRSVTGWSALRDLPYFDCVRASPIDVMHNILLGVCKHLMTLSTGHNLDDLVDGGAHHDQTDAPELPAATATAAAAAAAANPPAAFPFGKHELLRLQQFMDAAHPPRDIGRIRHKLTSLDHIKAVEWLNWVSMQAVPAVRTLVYERAVGPLSGDRKDKRMVTGEHLRLFSLAQQLLEELCAYTTSEAAIERIHLLLRKLVHSCASTFPWLGRRACTPNMHLALHLPAQLRDFGPVQGWWCFPFERLMGVAANVSSKPGTQSVDVARRLLSMIHLAAATASQAETAPAAAAAALRPAPPLNIFSATRRLQTHLPAPAGCGFTHAYTRACVGSALRHSFTFTPDDAGARAAAAVRAWRSGEMVEGWEPFPGVLFNSGSTHRRHAAAAGEEDATLPRHAAAAAAAPDQAQARLRVGLLQLVRTRCMLTADVDAEKRLRPDQQVKDRAPVSLAALQRALLAFYFKQFSEELVAHYAAQIAKVTPRRQALVEQVRARVQQEAKAEQVAAGAHSTFTRGARAAVEQRVMAAQGTAVKALDDSLLLLREEQEHFDRLQRHAQGCENFLHGATEAVFMLMHHTAQAPMPSSERSRQVSPAAAAAAAAASELASSAAGSADVDRVLPWSTALAWYEMHVAPQHASAHIDLFDKMLYCGEEISSDIASGTGVNSYIFALYGEADAHEQRAGAAAAAAAAAASPAQSRRWYGRVSYYARHHFKQRHYCFAVMRWYDRASVKALEALWPSYRMVHQIRASAASAAHRLRAEQCAESMHHWPVLNWAYRPEALDDLIPVHRIAGRWMPSLAQSDIGAHQLQVACPLRSRLYW